MTMEKPSKKLTEIIDNQDADGYSKSYVMGWNDCHDAMSTWLEGEVPTVEEIMKIMDDIAEDYIEDDSGCYELRDKQANAIHELNKRKLTGKV